MFDCPRPRAPAPRIARADARAGMTLIEVTVALAVSAVLIVSASFAIAKYGRRGAVTSEAEKLVDSFAELRSKAVTGFPNACLDFPAPDSARLYSDAAPVPDGFGPGDRVLGGYRFKGGIRAIGLAGGRGPTHAVCYSSKGITGSTDKALQVTLGAAPGRLDTRTVRLLPATGIARAQ